jgi:hypothetical protein
MDKENMVGYISLCPVDETVFKQIIKGTSLTEEQIEENVIPYRKISIYQVYLSSIVIDKDKYPRFSSKFLFRYLQKHIHLMKKRGFFIDKIIKKYFIIKYKYQKQTKRCK